MPNWLTRRSLDTVFLHLVLHAINDKHAAIKEFHRILRTDGKLAIDEEDVMQLEDIKKLAEEHGFKFSKRMFKTIQIFEKYSLSK